MKMKYEVILFDADDTLFDFRKSESHAFMKTMMEYQYPYDDKKHLKVYHEINSVIWKEFEKGEITQKDLKVDRFRRLKDALELSFNPEEFAKKYMYHLSQASFAYPESVQLMERLHGQYRLAIITNGLTQVQSIRIRNAPLARYFEEVVISEEINISKPDPEIFLHTLQKLGYHKREGVLMIGDSLSSDIKGGINAGIDTCWYNPASIENHTDIVPTYEVDKLMDILHLL